MNLEHVQRNLARRGAVPDRAVRISALALETEPMPDRLCDDNKKPLAPPYPSKFGRKPSTDRAPDWRKVDKGLVEMLDSASRGEREWPLLIHGKRGTGKSYAGLLMHQRFGGWIGTLAELATARNLAVRCDLWSGTSSHAYNEFDWWDHWAALPLVVVDEVGLRSEETDARYETLHTALTKRLGKPSIYVSNLALPDLLKIYDDRIGSRFGGGTKFLLDGKDRRLNRGER